MWFGHDLTYDRLKMHLFGIYIGFELMGVREGWEMFRWVEDKWLPEGRWPQEPSEYIKEVGWSEEESFYRLLDLHIEYWEQRLEQKPE